MDLGYVQYDNECERSIGEQKKAYRRKAKLAVYSRFYQTAICLSAKGI